jgi:small-conductance mechanosensitive channel
MKKKMTFIKISAILQQMKGRMMEDVYEIPNADNLDKLYMKHFTISLFQAVLSFTSIMGIFFFARELEIEGIVSWAVLLTWVLIMVGIHAYMNSAHEQRYKKMRIRYENLKSVKAQ